MNPLNPPAPGHDITRRNFMKKSALTVGAVTILAQGIGIAADSFSSICPPHLLARFEDQTPDGTPFWWTACVNPGCDYKSSTYIGTPPP